MKLKTKTWYNIIFYVFVFFTLTCYIYTIYRLIRWIVLLF
jgi:hypothetical protein